jgi:phosphate:Na+ symporter
MVVLRSIFSLTVGLSFFLGGMEAIKSSFYQTVNTNLKRLIKVLTVNLPVGLFTGVLITVLIQSSSAVVVIIISLVNAKLLPFKRAIGVIMGANIGTTVTIQLLSFNLENYVIWIIAAGLILYLIYYLVGYLRVRYIARGVLGFGILVTGLRLLGNGGELLYQKQIFQMLLTKVADVPSLGIVLAACLTAIIQSSSALNGLIIVFTKAELLNLQGAVALALGGNVGTCGTALLASIGTNKSACQVAWFHLLFNLCGVILIFPFLSGFIRLVTMTTNNLPRQVANAHTIFNIVNTFFFIIIKNKVISLIQWLSERSGK